MGGFTMYEISSESESILNTRISTISSDKNNSYSLRNYVYIQGVTGGTDQTSGVCSLGHTIPI